MSLISELRRRNVFRMAALYAVASWLIMQVADVLIALAGLPDWSGRVLLMVLACGFPLALVLSWFYELSPEGVSLEKDAESTTIATKDSGRRIDFIAISILCAALFFFAADKWWPRGPIEQSIAVLPFANLSDSTEQEYFSDGISEELLGVLARIPDIRVISRTSAFSYKGKQMRLTDIAGELNVAHVLDGSVRISGDRVRIMAQLIDARSDTQLWADTFDRKFRDIFAIQDEIATAVVAELEVQLIGPKPRVPETDPEAYVLYLQALYLSRQLTVESLQQSNELLQQFMSMDSDYAPAWDILANNYVFLAGYGLVPFEEGFRLANEAIDNAIAIDPGLAHAHALRGRIARGVDNDLAAAARHYKRALEIDATHDDVIRGAAVLLLSLGRIDMAMAFNKFAVEQDPVNPIGYSNLGMGYMYAERWDDAIAACRKALSLAPNHISAHYCVGEALLFRGDAKQASESFEQESLESLKLVGLTMAYHALGESRKSDAAMAELIDKHGESWAAQISYAYDYRNETDEAFQWLEKAVANKDPGVSEIFTGTLYFSNSRNDPRWEPFLAGIGYAQHQLDAIEFDVTKPKVRPQ